MVIKYDLDLPNKRFFRPDEVAAIFDVRARTIRKWCECGKLRYVRVGEKCIRIPRDALLTVISIDE